MSPDDMDPKAPRAEGAPPPIVHRGQPLPGSGGRSSANLAAVPGTPIAGTPIAGAPVGSGASVTGVPASGSDRPAAATPPPVKRRKAIDLAVIPPLPPVPSGEAPAPSIDPDVWSAELALFEAEAKTLGADPQAALLYLEMGRIFEEKLNKPRNAAMCYQRAFQLDPRARAVLHASRRLFAEVGNWQMVNQILQAEIEATAEPTDRAPLFVERAIVLETRQKNPEEAEKVYREALSLAPGLFSARLAVQQLDVARGDLAKVAELADAEPATGRAAALAAKAQLAENHLGAPDVAIAAYRELLELDPKSELALAGLRRLLAAVGDHAGLVEILVRSAERAENRGLAAAYLTAAGNVQEDHLGATDKALLLLLRALEYAPDDLVLLAHIERLYTENGKWSDVAKVLRCEIDLVAEPQERVRLLFRLGAVLEEHLASPDDAIKSYEECIRVHPSYTPAIQAAGRLYTRTGRFEDLARLFRVEIAADDHPDQKIARLLKLAEVEETRLERPDAAVATLVEVTRIAPGYPPAIKALERLYKKLDRHEDLIALLRTQIGLTEDRDQQIFLLARIAELAEEKLGDLGRAVAAYDEILALAPRHLEAIRSLARLEERRGNPAGVVLALEREAEATSDQNEVIAILHRIGSIQDEALKRPEEAIQTYEKVLTLAPTYLPALKSLGRLYHKSERWEDLLGMYRRELEVARSVDAQVEILFRMAGILEDKLKSDDRAIEVYEDVLSRMPDSLGGLEALSQLYARKGAHQRIAENQIVAATMASRAEDKARALFVAADIYQSRLGDLPKAAELYQKILTLGVHRESAIEPLIWIYGQLGRHAELVSVLEQAAELAGSPAAKIATLQRLAEVLSGPLGQGERAIRLLEQALELDPKNASALDQLARIHLQRRDLGAVADVEARLAELEPDPVRVAGRQLRIAVLKEQLDPVVDSSPHHLVALERDPALAVSFRALELAYRRAGAYAALTSLYRREANATPDPAGRANLLYRAADLAESALADHDLADALYVEVLRLVPGHLPALRARRRLAEALGDPSSVLAAILAEAEATKDPERATKLALETGVIYHDRVKDHAQAAQCYRRVLALRPEHDEAFRRLDELLTQEKRWLEVVDLLEARGKVAKDPAERARVLLRAGRIAQDQKDIQRALMLYREVLALEPRNAEALAHLGPLLYAVKAWDEAQLTLERAVEYNTEPATVASLHRMLGVVHQEHTKDLVRCVRSFQAAVSIDPRDTESLIRLARVYAEASDWASAVNVLLRLAEVQKEPAQRVLTLVELGKVYDQRFNDAANAAVAYQKALELEPGNQAAILQLLELHERTKNWSALAEIAERYVRSLPPGEKPKALPLHLKLARVYEKELGNDTRAITELRSALDVDPREAQALVELARLYAKSPTSIPQAIEIHRRLLRLDPFRVQSLHEMRALFERRQEFDRAFVVCEILVFLRSARQDEDLFFAEHKDKVAPHAAAALSPEEHLRWIVHPDERGLVRALLEAIGPDLGRVFPPEMANFEPCDRHGPRSDLPLRRWADEIGKVFGAPPFELLITKSQPLGFWCENLAEEGYALIVGEHVGRRMQERELRFYLGHQLERLKGAHHLFQKLKPKQLNLLLAASLKLVRPEMNTAIDPNELEDMKRRITKGLSRPRRKLLEQVGVSASELTYDPARYLLATAHTANRAGYIVTNDIDVAVRAIAKRSGLKSAFADANQAAELFGKSPEIVELLGFAVSDEYFQARTRLGFSIQS